MRRPRFMKTRRLRDPALDDPTHDDAEPQLTDDDLSGRSDGSEPLETHVGLSDATPPPGQRP